MNKQIGIVDVFEMGDLKWPVMVSRTGTMHLMSGKQRPPYAEAICGFSIDTEAAPVARARECKFCLADAARAAK